MQSIVTILVCILFFYWYLRYFERSNIYHPSKTIERSPQDIGLKYEDVNLKTDDGVQINGWFIPHKLPTVTILFCHGNAGNDSDRLDTIQFFHSLNLNVFIFDYRGYGKSQGKPTEIGTYKDTMSAYRYLEARNDIDTSKIIFYGESLGGAMAIELATKTKPAGVIINSTFTSVPDMSKEIYPWLPIQKLIKYRYDSLSKIKAVQCPILIMHSKQDDIVPYHHGRKLFDAANQPKEFLDLKGVHWESVTVNSDYLREPLMKFIQLCAKPV